MALLDELTELIDSIARSQWDVTDGRTVPNTDALRLANHGIHLDATMLYADLADSTSLALHNDTIAAEVFKAFLAASTRIIRANEGYVRSFDGDRVMAVFIGASKNSNAARTALKINYMFTQILVPRFKQQWEVFRSHGLTLAHCVGIDTSKVLVARAGIRDNNDLIWVGQAPNIAAKLSTLRDAPFHSYITKAVYDMLAQDAKETKGAPMWEARNWSALPAGLQSIYRSSWTWQP